MNGFDKLDGREFILHKGFSIAVTIRQLELLRLIKICESVHSNGLASKLKRLLFVKDYNEGTKTETDRELPKGDINKYVMTPKDFDEMVHNQRELDGRMEAYYGKKI